MRNLLRFHYFMRFIFAKVPHINFQQINQKISYVKKYFETPPSPFTFRRVN
jgi:hypothetical protein